MKTNLILLTLVVALGIFAWWKMSGETKDTYSENIHTQFAVEDATQIARIFIADRAGNQALIEKKDGAWVYTNKATGRSYLANPDAIATLLETTHKIRTRAPVPETRVPTVIKTMATNAKKVELYDTDGKRVRTYYVGGSADRGEATYMMMEGTERPYIVYFPNWLGDLNTRYIVEEKYWRDRAIFRVAPNTLQFVQVEYVNPIQQEYSFRIERKGAKQYTVQSVFPATKKLADASLNQDNADVYMTDFDVVIAEKIIEDPILRDSIITSPLFAKVTYQTTQMTAPVTFKIYPLYNLTGDRGDGETGQRQRIQRYFVDIASDQFYLIQHGVIQKILWGYPFFFRKEQVVLEIDATVFKPLSSTAKTQ